MVPNVADIIARMNWEMSALSNLDSSKNLEWLKYNHSTSDSPSFLSLYV
jgi:hypothetical protein